MDSRHDAADREPSYPLAWSSLALLAVLLLLIHAYVLETDAFRRVFSIAAVGSVIVHALTARWRLPFFVLLSVASGVVALGGWAATIVFAIGLVLIGVCHLPLGFLTRVVILGVTGVTLANVRYHGHPQIPSIVWPVLASMFMFRLVLYMHALRQRNVAFSPELALSYFFMLPNACFPLFPVVDYAKFVQGSRAADRGDTYEQGVRWIARGVIHLLLYRLVFFQVAPRELFVYDLGDVVLHLLSGLLLYLKISGHFHLIVGMLHLFGFRLPETHHLYLLAPSISEFWRRINIYWKDFLAKIVYFPTFAALHGRPPRVRLLAATLMVFVASWALHAYHVFWTEGRPLLSGIDMLFWTIFALWTLVAVARRKRHDPPLEDARAWSAARSMAVMRTFVLVSVLWSFWTTDTVGSWFHMLKQVQRSQPSDWLLLGAVLVGGSIVAGYRWEGVGPRVVGSVALRQSPVIAYARAAVLLLACFVPLAEARAWLPIPLRATARHLEGRGVELYHEVAAIPGYYERLTRRVPEPVAAVPAAANAPARADATPVEPLIVPRGDFLLARLGRSVRTTVEGQVFSTNALGLRGREYLPTKPPDTVRIAFVGASDVMGTGVADDATIDAYLEPMLDEHAKKGARHVEVLNFGYWGWTIAQRAVAVAELVAPVKPDLVLFSVNGIELQLFAHVLHAVQQRHIDIPVSAVADAVRSSGIEAGMGVRETLSRLRPYEPAILADSIRMAQENARRLGVPLVLVALQMPGVPSTGALPLIADAAASSGLPMLDCTKPWRGRDTSTLVVSEQDSHANGEGTRLIAQCVHEQLTTLPAFAQLLADGTRQPIVRPR